MAPSPSPLALLSRGAASGSILWGVSVDGGRAERAELEQPHLCLRQPAAALPAAPNTACLAHSRWPPSDAELGCGHPSMLPRSRCVCTLGQALARAGLQVLSHPKPSTQPASLNANGATSNRERLQDLAASPWGPWWLAGWVD